jgi:hypothetical protein
MKTRLSALLGAVLILGLTIVMAVPNVAEAFYSFRCGTKLVRVGDTKTDILQKCGSPTLKTPGRDATGGADVWTYNQGSGKTMRILRFTGPKVTAIDSSNNYGFAGQ